MVGLTKIFLNELSIRGAFNSPADFEKAFEDLLQSRARSRRFAEIFYCSRSLRNEPAYPGTPIVAAAQRLRRDLRELLFSWAANYGPFLEDALTPIEADELYSFEGHDVSLGGLGEAARRLRGFGRAATFSFLGDAADFSKSPLPVVRETNVASETIDVENFSAISDCVEYAEQQQQEPRTWAEVLDTARGSCKNIHIAVTAGDPLASEPFHSSAARRIGVLLAVLDQVAGCMDDGGKLSLDGKELVQKFFVGEEAPFTDESEGNKRKFKDAMTFRDDSTAEDVVCFWHGKIKSPVYRIHFEWPAKRPRVMYIGPKISKR